MHAVASESVAETSVVDSAEIPAAKDKTGRTHPTGRRLIDCCVCLCVRLTQVLNLMPNKVWLLLLLLLLLRQISNIHIWCPPKQLVKLFWKISADI